MSSSKTVYVPVAQFHRGNTSTYVERALQQLGHTAKIINSLEFYARLKTDPDALFFCVDSGEPINLEVPEIRDVSLERVAYWLIDFRHHKNGPRFPTDIQVCTSLHNRGGWIFQSQYEDWEFSVAQGWQKSRFLPLAADPEVWSAAPLETKVFDIAFAGNVWDKGRASVLESLLRLHGVKFGFPGHGKLWMEDAARLLRSAHIGFNVSSWYGTEHDFDINMRFFETLSCGVPLITNWVPSIERIFPKGAPFVATYRSAEEVEPLLADKLLDKEFLLSGREAQDWIVRNGSYTHRMTEALSYFSDRT